MDTLGLLTGEARGTCFPSGLSRSSLTCCLRVISAAWTFAVRSRYLEGVKSHICVKETTHQEVVQRLEIIGFLKQERPGAGDFKDDHRACRCALRRSTSG